MDMQLKDYINKMPLLELLDIIRRAYSVMLQNKNTRDEFLDRLAYGQLESFAIFNEQKKLIKELKTEIRQLKKRV
ncbi:MAG: hypothetical protein LBJ73_03490 [Rickettsiales bacterium]|jgi:hypothetical protein|nr:hypothetical protein [Rickettsiales bacterium]